MQDLVRVELPDGQFVWARVDVSGPRDVAFQRTPQVLKGLTETVRGVAANVRDGLRGLNPDEITVEFGVELAMADGGLVAALAGAKVNSSIAVTLGWRPEPAPGASPANPAPAAAPGGEAQSGSDAGS